MAAKGALLATFFQESEDLLEVVADSFEVMGSGESDSETINSVFRAVHSIKGGAAAFGLKYLVDFAHCLENLLDDLRTEKVQISQPLCVLLVECGDQLFQLVEGARGDQSTANAANPGLFEALDQACAAKVPAGASDADPHVDAVPDLAFTPQVLDLGLDIDRESGSEDPSAGQFETIATDRQDSVYEICLSPSRGLFSCGNDPLRIIAALHDLGKLHVCADISNLSTLSEMDCADSCLGWHFTLETGKPRTEILSVFSFIEDCVSITGVNTELNLSAIAPDQSPDSEPITPENVMASPTKAIKTALGATGPVNPNLTGSDAAGPAHKPRSIRVDLERVDRLINLVGELVISEAMLTQTLSASGKPLTNGADAALSQLKRLSSEIQERIMAIRAQPVKPLFQRMSRIAREAAKSIDRSIQVKLKGEATEIDKTVIERLADPLTHMIRNAVDHGIEPSADRIAAGKPGHGTICITASHRSGQVIIDVSDDGAGIDRAQVLARAVERGLAHSDMDPASPEVLNLLFAPGFSLAKKVTNLSGRGVGMDVVLNMIRELGGRVSIASELGMGSTVTISLPLTLAVVSGMLVRVGTETLVIPATSLRESLRASPSHLHYIGSGDPMLSLRGAVLPLVDLSFFLGYRAAKRDVTNKPLLIVESASGRQLGLIVDETLGQREVVIKRIDGPFGRPPGISAATILGNGRIALIVDIDRCMGLPSHAEHETNHTVLEEA